MSNLAGRIAQQRTVLVRLAYKAKDGAEVWAMVNAADIAEAAQTALDAGFIGPCVACGELTVGISCAGCIAKRCPQPGIVKVKAKAPVVEISKKEKKEAIDPLR